MRIRPLDAWCLAARLSVCGALALQGCGGASESSEAVLANDVPGNPALVAMASSEPTSGDNCLRVPALPGPAGPVRSVAEFGALPNDSGDDTLAIQRALDALNAGQTLIFPAGRYFMSRSLRVRVPGSVLDGRGATLHATNPDDQAIRIEADDVTVRSFSLTAITDVRRSAPWHARIAVYALNADGTHKTIRRTVIQDNTITHAGAPGTPGANGASAGGIVLLQADGFLVAGNTVARTLADGIHITSGSRNGRVLGNTVRETGDDMIAVVSYAGSGNAALGSAAKLRAAWATRVETRLARNIVIADNRLSGQYWGRGVSVVGGKDISLRRNTLDNLPLAAGILVAREAGYESFGVNNVLVEGNSLTNVQNLAPPYDAGGKYAAARPTGHGAVEIHAAVFDDEAADPQLKTELTVRNVKVNGNLVRHASAPGLRSAIPIEGTLQAVDPTSGATVARRHQTAAVQAVSSQDNRFEGIAGGNAMQIVTAGMANGELNCKGNTRDGQPYTVAACLRPEFVVTGAVMKCTADGRVP